MCEYFTNSKMHKYTCLIVVLVYLPIAVFADEIRIGFLNNDHDVGQELAFRLGIKKVNKQHMLKPHRLNSTRKTIIPDDTFQISQSTCSLLSNAVVGIFGPNTGATSNYVQSVCDTKEIPHIETRSDIYQQRGTCLVNLHPHPPVLSKVFVDLIKAWGWESFMVLYEDNYSLSRIKYILGMHSESRHHIFVKQLDPHFGNNFRPTLKAAKLMGAKNFVLDCSIDVLYEVLKQAQQIGLMTDRQQFIITNLDFHTLNLSIFKYSGTNITGVGLIDCNTDNVKETIIDLRNMKLKTEKVITYNPIKDACQLRVDHALIIDAIVLFSLALKEYSKSHNFKAKSLLCNSTVSWEHGYSIINYMKMKTLHGLTGHVKFDHQGYRSDFHLDVLELTELGLNKVGEWNSTDGLKMQRRLTTGINVDETNLQNKTLVVIICLTDPYGMLKEAANTLKGNDRFEGFGIDLIHELSVMLGFNYIFRVQEDGANGALNRETGEWNGMIRELLDFRADLAITDLTITSERENAVDFTHPFMNLGISILYKRPEKLPPSFFSFTTPFSKEVWFLLSAGFCGVSLMLFVMGRICSAEWRNPNACIQNPEYLICQFSFRNSLWFTISSLMQQGSEIAPVAISTRMVAGLWWFFTLIMVSTYQANLAASLTVETKYSHFSDVEGLVEKLESSQIAAGAKAGGATANFFRDSNLSTYQRVWKYMDSHPSAMTANNTRGVDRANQEDYAFFMESTTIQYTIQRECNLTQVGNLLDDKGYGIAMRQNSSYRNALSAAIVKLQENGKLAALKLKWWKEKRGGSACSTKSDSKVAPALTLDNVGGVFLVLVIGTLSAFVFVFIETMLHVAKESFRRKLSFNEEMKEELRFFLKFKGMVKKVRKKRSDSMCLDRDYSPMRYGYTTSDLL